MATHIVVVISYPSRCAPQMACSGCSRTVGLDSLAEAGPSSKLQTRVSHPRVRFFGSTRKYIDVNTRGTARNNTHQHIPPFESRALGILAVSNRELLVPALGAPQGRVWVKHNHHTYIRGTIKRRKDRRVSRRCNWKLTNTCTEETRLSLPHAVVCRCFRRCFCRGFCRGHCRRSQIRDFLEILWLKNKGRVFDIFI